jgi:hypothetical protein
MRRLISILNKETNWKTVACCCGHGKYNPSLIVIDQQVSEWCNEPFDLFSDTKFKHGTKKFYKKDKQGYYYIYSHEKSWLAAKAAKNEVNKMGIDKETVPTNVFISVTDNKEYLARARKEAVSMYGEKDKDCMPALLIDLDGHSFEMEEYYLNDEGVICLSGNLTSPEGKTYLGLNIPLSDTVLIDVLQYSIKKLNKLKAAMESLA